ncbi:BQ5605_C011g06342 [Microbotryum silenes-dioicae]|uniref:BQ5605_C011g06342 protein n=1 Tax=Microbotryum silenes-dioicae TaxID=796604 RepID=A0A2X0LT17_9BASI|nr:BQ5605_C011g06342 [Microbotryum silenes-dioicae]
MLSFVLLQLEPLFRYNSREWSGESKVLAFRLFFCCKSLTLRTLGRATSTPPAVSRARKQASCRKPCPHACLEHKPWPVSRTRAGISPSTLPPHWVSSALPVVAVPVFAAYLCHLLPRLDLPSDTNTQLPPSLLPCQTTTDSCPLPVLPYTRQLYLSVLLLTTVLAGHVGLLGYLALQTTLATQRASVQGRFPSFKCVTLSKQRSPLRFDPIFIMTVDPFSDGYVPPVWDAAHPIPTSGHHTEKALLRITEVWSGADGGLLTEADVLLIKTEVEKQSLDPAALNLQMPTCIPSSRTL